MPTQSPGQRGQAVTRPEDLGGTIAIIKEYVYFKNTQNTEIISVTCILFPHCHNTAFASISEGGRGLTSAVSS